MMTFKKGEKIRYTLLILFVTILVIMASHTTFTLAFNQKMRTTIGADSESASYMRIAGRGDATSIWKKRNFDLYGETVDLNAKTVDFTLYNHAKDRIASWNMVLNIKNDCFINNAWCGFVEIHQFVGTDREKVQLLDLRNYRLDDIELAYLYDGDLLIPLKKGDQIYYYPSAKDREMPIEGESELTAGAIFYYMDDVDLTDYHINYYYKRTIFQGIGFYATVVLFIIWSLLFAMYKVAQYTYRKAWKEMELRKSSLSCMSEIYSIIYYLNLEKNTLEPIYADEESEKKRPKDMGAREQLQNLFQFDADDAYREFMLEFSDLTTLPQRLEQRDSIVCEYISKAYGWCLIRFFAMERAKDAPLKKVIFTIQEINDEKAEMREVEERITRAESENRAKSVFLANMSHEIRTPINTVLGLDTMILRESKEDHIRTYAKEIKSAGKMLLSLINGILDSSKLEAGKMELVLAEYSLKQLLFDVRTITKAIVDAKHLDYVFDIAPALPDKLYGDDVRIKQIIINLLTNAAKYTEKGSVTLSVHGEMTGDCLALHIAVKDTGMGIRKEDLQKLAERFIRLDEKRNRNIEGTGLGMSLVKGLLELMDSQLQISSTYGEGSEFSFTIRQQVLDQAPIGEIDFENMEVEDDDGYEVTFLAPDAHILVVDDNPMNLMVFENLLKETEVKIEKANSGKEALLLTKENPYDIIFMDHMMPEMDGIECFHKIRKQKNGQNKETPVLVLTANALHGAKEEYLREGFTDFLKKPVDPAELEEKVANNLPKDKIAKAFENGGAKKQRKTAEALPEIEGVDLPYALQHMGDAASVLSIMKQFTDMADADADELIGYFERLKQNQQDEESLRSFRIKVHAMKTSAGLFGALQVYGVAAFLELAAREGALKTIMDVTPHFMTFWQKLNQNLQSYFNGQEKEKAPTEQNLEKEEAEALLHQLETSMNNYDIKSADQLLIQLEGYPFPQDKQALLAELKLAVSQLDAEKTTVLCKKLKE